jgi:AcrR family transcriptional regulator
MTKPRKANPDAILDAAAELFASRQFHEVRLDDIAASAHVGKGTLYLYWRSKEDVYLAIIRRGFAAVLDRIRDHPASSQADAWQSLEAIVEALVEFAFKYPGVYRIMRSGILTPEDADIQRVRGLLVEKIVEALQRGIASGVLEDESPELTAQYVLSFVRGAVLYPPEGLTPESLRQHMMRLLRRGLGKEARP